MKMVIDLPASTDLSPGTVIHTFGYPEPEIFGFLYVHPGNVATAGIFVPSWFRSPARTVSARGKVSSRTPAPVSIRSGPPSIRRGT